MALRQKLHGSTVSGGDDDEYWMDEYNWYDSEDMLYDQEGRSAVDRVTESYDEYISTN